MGVIQVTDSTVERAGGVEVFRGISFKIGHGQHVALVGENGVGKSTLMAAIVGDVELLEGAASTDARVVFMPQHVGSESTGRLVERKSTTVRELMAEFSTDEVRAAARSLLNAERKNNTSLSTESGIQLASAIAEWAQIGGYLEESVWDSICQSVLGKSFEGLSTFPVGNLSGGERKRLVLELLFRSDAPILLLDEPDNYLDISAKRWLESQIAESHKTILFVSHDRELISNSATSILTLETNSSWFHSGDWKTYEDARKSRNRALAHDVDRWKAEERRLFQLVKEMKRRAAINDDNAPRARAAETRWKRFVDAGPPLAPPVESSPKLRLEGASSGKIVLQCEGLELVGLTDPFDFEAFQGDRIGILGPNGTGKSHLLRLLASDQTVLSAGRWRLGARVVAGLFHQADDAPRLVGRRLIDIVSAHGMNEERARSCLGRYGLSAAATREYETLSGGQRARLQILDLELTGVNLLLLDEPTDNLDIASAEALEASLRSFEGTVLCVSHDRWFMRSMTRWLIVDDRGQVIESLDLSSALRVLTEDSAYDLSPSALISLNVE